MNLKEVEKILLFLTLLFLPTQLGLHFWPNFSQLYSLKIDYLSPTIYFWDLLCLFLILIWILQKPKINKVAFNVLFIFLLTQSFSFFSNFEFGVGAVRLEQYLITGLFGLYISSQNFDKIKSLLFFALYASIIVESLLAVAQFIKSSTLGFWILGERDFNIATPAIAKFDYQGREFLRPYGTFPHPNVLGGFLVTTLSLLGLVRPKFKKSWTFKKTTFIISVFIGAITTFLTVSRTAIFAGFLEGFFLLRSRWLYILIVGVIVLSPILYTRFAALVNFDILSFDRRDEQINLGFDIFAKNPFFGIGLNNFIPYAASDIVAGPSRFLQPIHNIYLLELVETGLFGFLGFVLLIFYPINLLMRKTSSYQVNILLSIWLLILFLGMFDHYLLTLQQGYRLLFLVWGISLSHEFRS